MTSRPKGRLTKVEVEYIQNHSEELDPKQLAKDIGCSVVQITDYIKRNKLAQVEQVTQPQPAPVAQQTAPVKTQPSTSPAMPDSKKVGDRGVSVMTQAASEWADEIRRTKGGSHTRNTSNCVAKVRQ